MKIREWQLERHGLWLRIVLYYTLGKLVTKMGNCWTDHDTIQMIIFFRVPLATSNFLVRWVANNTCPTRSLLLTENKSYGLQVRPSQESVFPKVHRSTRFLLGLCLLLVYVSVTHRSYFLQNLRQGVPNYFGQSLYSLWRWAVCQKLYNCFSRCAGVCCTSWSCHSYHFNFCSVL